MTQANEMAETARKNEKRLASAALSRRSGLYPRSRRRIIVVKFGGHAMSNAGANSQILHENIRPCTPRFGVQPRGRPWRRPTKIGLRLLSVLDIKPI